MCSSGPIERTIASEFGCTGSRSTRWFHGLSAGNTGQPASTAAPMATLPYISAGGAGGGEAAPLPPPPPARPAPPPPPSPPPHPPRRRAPPPLPPPPGGG